MGPARRSSGALSRFLLIGLCAVPAAGAAAQSSADYEPPDGVAFRTASIMSDGTRIHAEIYSPAASADQRLPTIIQAHGWGGLAANLRNDSADFARAGYHVITFDYRGWGESDARVILSGAEPDGEGRTYTAQVEKIEGVVDPFDQTDDWFSVVHWTMGDPLFDPDRIGIRGSSLSGGHVIYVAAHEPRIRALVAQVPATDATTGMPQIFEDGFDIATRRTRGELGYPPPRIREFNLTGTAIHEKFLRYDPNAVAHRVEAAALVIVAESEELYNNETQGKLAYERLTSPKAYEVIPDITHYAVYGAARERIVGLAIDWFDRFLKP